MYEFSRTELLIGSGALKRLADSTVAVFGVGGVGSFVVEGLARAGVGRFVLVDHDTVCITNINRQIHATRHTVGLPKVEVMRQRVLDINPKAQVATYQKFYLPESGSELICRDYDYIVDAVDTVAAKIDLAVKAFELGIPIISSMGAGNKLDPTKFEVADIYKTSVCPLARVMRQQLKKLGLPHLKVVYSREQPVMSPNNAEGLHLDEPNKRRTTPGSISFVPSVAGLIIAGEVVKDLIKS